MVSLARARRNAGFSQRELAAAANVSAATVRAIETGRRRRPHPRTMRQLAAAVGLPIPRIDEFANGDPPGNSHGNSHGDQHGDQHGDHERHRR